MTDSTKINTELSDQEVAERFVRAAIQAGEMSEDESKWAKIGYLTAIAHKESEITNLKSTVRDMARVLELSQESFDVYKRKGWLEISSSKHISDVLSKHAELISKLGE